MKFLAHFWCLIRPRLLIFCLSVLASACLSAQGQQAPAVEASEQASLRDEALRALRSGDEKGACLALEALGASRHASRRSKASVDAMVLQAMVQAALCLHEEHSPGLGLALGLHARRLQSARFSNASEQAAALYAQALLTDRLWGDRRASKVLYQKVLKSDPSHKAARDALARLAAAQEAEARWAEDNHLARNQEKSAP